MKRPFPVLGIAREGLVLLAVAAAAAGIWWWGWPAGAGTPGTVPPVAQASPAEAEAWGPRVLWVDARPADAYQAAHVPGAISLPPDQWESQLPRLLEAWRPGVSLVVYCDSRECDASRLVADRLGREVRLPGVFVLAGGWAEWRKAHP